MQERQKAVITLRAAAVVSRAIGVEPALWFELERVRAPEGRGGVDRPGGEDDGRVLRDEVAGQCGVVGGHAHGEGDGRPEAEDLGADGVQVVAVVEVGGADFVLQGREFGADFGAEFGLDGGVFAEEVDAPAEGVLACCVCDGGVERSCEDLRENGVVGGKTVSMQDLHQSGRRRLMTGNEESHHLIDQLLIGETTRIESDGDDILARLPLLVHHLTLALDQIPTSLLNELLSLDDFLISFTKPTRQHVYNVNQSQKRSISPRNPLKHPKRYEKARDLPELASSPAEGEDVLIMHVELIVRIAQRLKVPPHARLADNIQRGARTPLADFNHAGSVSLRIRG